LVNNRISPTELSEENTIIDGMKALFEQGFCPLEVMSDQGLLFEL
jgi:hypothetical protein